MDTYTPQVLLGVVDGLIKPHTAVLGRYFPTVEQSETDVISFDVIDKARRLAPFVSPLVAGKIVRGQGYSTKTFSPAYIKDKRPIDPSKALKRAAGEPFGANWSPEKRRQAAIARELEEQIEMIDRRLEVMAVEALRLAQVTVTGDDYPTVVVEFGRDAALSIAALAGTNKWTDAASKPLKNLKAWQKLVRQKSGSNPIDVIMGDDAFDAFSDHQTVRDLLDNRRMEGGSLTTGSEVVEGLTFQGTVNRMNIFTYSGWYVDPADGDEKEIFPAGEIVLASSAVEGVQSFGAIKDVEAGFAAFPRFPKMWVEKDPSQEILLMQSAPLTVPTRPNATLRCAGVI